MLPRIEKDGHGRLQMAPRALFMVNSVHTRDKGIYSKSHPRAPSEADTPRGYEGSLLAFYSSPMDGYREPKSQIDMPCCYHSSWADYQRLKPWVQVKDTKRCEFVESKIMLGRESSFRAEGLLPAGLRELC